jgi:hypothetical protein
MMAETADMLQARRAQIEADKVAAKAPKNPPAQPWTHSTPNYGNLNPATPGGAGSAAGLVLLAGAIAFFGNMKVDSGFPKAGTRIVAASLLLAIILSLFDNSRFSPIARGLGYLMVLTSLIVYVPKFSTKKGK